MTTVINFKYDNHHENVNAERRLLEMKVSREQMAQNRSRILTEAGRLFREKGFDAVSVAEVMKAAGLTHGGFYGHFRSKDDLIAHAIGHTVGSESATDDIGAWIDTYLSLLHRDHPEAGCPTAALAGLMRQQAPEARASMAQVLAGQIGSLTTAMPGTDAAERRLAAIGSWSAMVGALILARSIDDPVLSNELLTKTRTWIDDRNSRGPDSAGRERRAA
jgi:TetR/AcrR family transcriptional repressor of nem operon